MEVALLGGLLLCRLCSCRNLLKFQKPETIGIIYRQNRLRFSGRDFYSETEKTKSNIEYVNYDKVMDWKVEDLVEFVQYMKEYDGFKLVGVGTDDGTVTGDVDVAYGSFSVGMKF